MKSLITKRSQRIITIIIALVLLLNCSTFTSAKQIEPAEGQWESKIEEDLREAMEAASDDEYIPICLWREKIDKAEWNALMIEKTGFDPELYEDIAVFNERVLPEIENEVRDEQINDVGAIRHAANMIINKEESKKDEADRIKEATEERIKEYIHQKRVIAREEYPRRNKEFLANALEMRDDRNIIFCSRYSPTIFIEATKSEIQMLANDESVNSISLYVEFESEPTMCDVLSQTGVYCEGGTGYDQAGLWSALTGINITIGVLESSYTSGYGGRFDDTAPQLNGNTNLHFIDNIRTSGNPVPYVYCDHATEVVSIIAGQSVVYNGKTYRGVVPDATIYQTPVYLQSDFATGLEACMDHDVIIVNMSLGGSFQPYYSPVEKVIDDYSNSFNVVIVVSAGNEGNSTGEILSPGRALNAITVGNARTKSDANTVLSAPYSVANSSSYVEESYCANKPDLVAPGCFSVLMYDLNNQIVSSFGTGTSYSAPIVTGIVAQLFDRDLIYSLHPTMAKAAVLVGADLSQMDTTNDTPTATSTPYFYDKCGAGMVNAINTNKDVKIEYLGQITNSTNTSSTFSTLNAGDRFRAVLTFNKNNTADISSTSDLDDLDLLLVKRNNFGADILVDYSLSYTNNDEIIDVTIPETGDYYLIIYKRSIKDVNNPPTACVMYKRNP